jgi:hypothetical protein
VSSRIVNGISRMVDLLKVMRLWGEGDSDAGQRHRCIQQTSSYYKESELSSGKSDASFHKRLHFESLEAAVGLLVNYNVLQL